MSNFRKIQEKIEIMLLSHIAEGRIIDYKTECSEENIVLGVSVMLPGVIHKAQIKGTLEN